MIANALGPVFLLILLGAGLKYIHFAERPFWANLERLTYFVLFPALLIYKLAIADFTNASLAKIAVCIVIVLVAISTLLFLLRASLAKSGAAFTSVFQGSIRFNSYIGLACASVLYGEKGLVLAAVCLALMIPLINLLCIGAFSLVISEDKFHWKNQLVTILKNPLILGCLIGIFLNQTGIGLPGWSADFLRILSTAALPLGLLAVGCALDIRAVNHSIKEILFSSAIKFLALPALMFLLCELFGVEPQTKMILMLFASLPTASSAYILARQLGGDTALMANIITLQTLLAFVAIPVWIGLAG